MLRHTSLTNNYSNIPYYANNLDNSNNSYNPSNCNSLNNPTNSNYFDNPNNPNNSSNLDNPEINTVEMCMMLWFLLLVPIMYELYTYNVLVVVEVLQ